MERERINENPEKWIDVGEPQDEFPHYHFKSGVVLSPREAYRVRNLARVVHMPVECIACEPSGPAIQVRERRHFLSLIPGRLVTNASYDSGNIYFEPETRDESLKRAIERTFEAWGAEFNS